MARLDVLCQHAPFPGVAANTHPDHDTLAAFRRRFLKELEALFVQVLELAREMKLLKLGHIALDGTKIGANASKHHALSWGHANKIEAQLRLQVQALLALAETSDRAAVPDGMDVPAEIARREDRLGAIAQAKAKIEQRAAERHQLEQQDDEDKTAKRKSRREAGKKPRGKDPEPPQAGPKDGDQVNLTDEQSRIMPVSGGGFEQSYNEQAGWTPRRCWWSRGMSAKPATTSAKSCPRWSRSRRCPQCWARCSR